MKYTKDQLRKAAFGRTSIVGAHVGIAQWKPLLEVVQGEWRQLEVHVIEKLCKGCLDQEKEGCKINNKDTAAQLKHIKDRKDAHGLDQDLNLIQGKQDDTETKEGRHTKQGRGHAILTDLGERRHYKPATKAKHLRCACATVGEHRRFRCKETMTEEDHL